MCPSDVILIYPCNHPRWPLLPSSSLALVNPLRRAGFSPRIVDTAVDDYRAVDYGEAICVGISALTDQSILKGIEVVRHVRTCQPDLPIVWGGHHPTVLPGQTLDSPAVDIVCRNEGELAFPELVRRLAERRAFDDVAGITWRDASGAVVHNPDQRVVDMDSLERFPYEVLDPAKYPIIHERFAYQSSRGCPCRCRFCSFDVLKRWRPRSAEKMVDDLGWILQAFHPTDVEMADDNFFVNRKRVESFCRLVVDQRLPLRWSANCRFDYFAEYDDDLIQLLKASGCYLLCFGGESGSDRILEYVDKKLRREQILESVMRARRNSLRIQTSFMCGFPGESDREVLATVSLMEEIKRISPAVEVNGFFVYTPYPGSALFDDVRHLGFEPPASLEAWGEFNPNLEHSVASTPWLSKRRRRRLETIGAMVRFEFLLGKYREMSFRQRKSWFFGSAVVVALFEAAALFFRASRWLRWRTKRFELAWEWAAWSWLRDRFLGRA